MPVRETPFWWADAPEPLSLDSGRPLPERIDVVVIGGGYTGLSAARALARAGASVLVLEKETIGWGASSRNGGQVLTGLKVGPETLLRRYGRERARAFYQASLDAIDFLETLVAVEPIDCEYHRSGHVEAAFKPSHFEAFKRQRDVLAEDLGHEVRLVGRAEQRAELGSDLYHGLMIDGRSASLHPARYVRGLASAAAGAGAVLLERTPVLDVRRDGGGIRVITARGAVATRDVLVATNGYTDAALPALRRRVVPVGSYVIATARLPAALAATLLPRRRVAFDSKHFLYYFRLSADERLLFGGRAQFTPSTARTTRTSAEILRRGMLRVFPELADVEVEFAWGGNLGVTVDLLPRAGRLDGLHFALGYAGHGVAMATYLGDVMADVILGRPDRNPFRDLPFQPIPLYHGRPWFLPLAGLWYRILDWMQ